MIVLIQLQGVTWYVNYPVTLQANEYVGCYRGYSGYRVWRARHVRTHAAPYAMPIKMILSRIRESTHVTPVTPVTILINKGLQRIRVWAEPCNTLIQRIFHG